MSEKALGKQGSILMLTMLTMLTMSTGSGEIMGVSSVIVYDIYQTYICPYRPKLPSGFCLFCGFPKNDSEHRNSVVESNMTLTHKPDGPGNGMTSQPICKCPSAVTCEDCKADQRSMREGSKWPGRVVIYKCPYHASYRTYQDQLIDFKNWTVLWVSIALIPFGMVVHASGVDLNWTMMYGVILTVPAFPGVIASILWVKTTGKGIIIGSISGLLAGLAGNAGVSYGYYKGAGGFLVATTMPYSTLAGSSLACLVSLAVSVVVSLATHNIHTAEDEESEWQKPRDIDNPLHPWALQYEEYFPEVRSGLHRPTYTQMAHVSRLGRMASIIGAVFFFIIFIIVIPATMSGLEVLDAGEFRTWTTLINVWCMVMAVIIVLVTPIEEVKAILQQLWAKRHRQTTSDDVKGSGSGSAPASPTTLRQNGVLEGEEKIVGYLSSSDVEGGRYRGHTDKDTLTYGERIVHDRDTGVNGGVVGAGQEKLETRF
ncbi:uncharacterized protein LOC118477851 [Aplysia californica]|uniref:Uncharacterized protein LOC118477851 n=1 Tax=Aplysia californica TaxID=6500 RepID=A0ABM1VUX8_APLCA|nr:uncharacterized protein LOC118477851 [Aplysia californica]